MLTVSPSRTSRGAFSPWNSQTANKPLWLTIKVRGAGRQSAPTPQAILYTRTPGKVTARSTPKVCLLSFAE
jgi:hypothetical protein